MELAELSWTDAREAEVDLVLLPVGSTEQHGPHAPLGTDRYLAEAVAERGDATTDHATVIAPTLPFGIAEEHRAFDGTMWLSPDTFRDAIRDAVESLAHHGWSTVVVVNGHGGNANALREVSAALTREDAATCVPFTWFDVIDLPAEVPMGHAGAVETAGMLATRPELVHEDLLEAASADAAERWGNWVAGVNIAVDTAEFSENGVVGNPAGADPELGRSLLDQAGSRLATLIDALVEG